MAGMGLGITDERRRSGKRKVGMVVGSGRAPANCVEAPYEKESCTNVTRKGY